MLEFLKNSDGHMKQSKLNMESLSKPELLMLFSILEGELEARDLVIDALKAQRKDAYVQERYGRYDLSDPFLALQRDGEAVGGDGGPSGKETSSSSNPLVVLRLVVSHCRRMQDKMLAQLAAAESRHRRVILDLEEEKRRHAEDTAEGDDVTYILEKERERLHQQLDFERSQVRRLEKEQRRVSEQLEEERAQHKQLSCALAKECKWASARALDEGQRVAELNRKLDKEKEASHAVRRELEEERRRALRMEARVEEQLAEFDTEREQLRSRLKKEEAHCCQLQQQVEELRRTLEVAANTERGGGGGGGRGPSARPEEQRASAEEEAAGRRKEELTRRVPLAKTRTDGVQVEDIEEEEEEEEEGSLPPVWQAAGGVNGHHRCPATAETNGHHRSDADITSVLPENTPVLHAKTSSLHPPGGTDTSSLTPSSSSSSSPPCASSSPVPDKQSPGGGGSLPGGYQSSYQAGINQRFHAARHKFQGTAAAGADPSGEPQPTLQASQPASSSSSAPQSSKEASPSSSPPSPSPPAAEASPVKQLARSTVTQVLSRFTTVQQSVVAKLPNTTTAAATTPNNSPFGTDYRSLAAPLSPVVGRASASVLPTPPQGIRSPTIPRADRGNPPPIPPKKPGLAQAQAPASPAPVPRSATTGAGHFSDGPLSASCGLVTSSQEAVKELDMVVSSN